MPKEYKSLLILARHIHCKTQLSVLFCLSMSSSFDLHVVFLLILSVLHISAVNVFYVLRLKQEETSVHLCKTYILSFQVTRSCLPATIGRKQVNMVRRDTVKIVMPEFA